MPQNHILYREDCVPNTVISNHIDKSYCTIEAHIINLCFTLLSHTHCWYPDDGNRNSRRLWGHHQQTHAPILYIRLYSSSLLRYICYPQDASLRRLAKLISIWLASIYSMPVSEFTMYWIHGHGEMNWCRNKL